MGKNFRFRGNFIGNWQESLVQENTLIWYDVNLKNDRNFGGVRIDGLISHAFLFKYSWTINFDKYEYIFGIH